MHYPAIDFYSKQNMVLSQHENDIKVIEIRKFTGAVRIFWVSFDGSSGIFFSSGIY